MSLWFDPVPLLLGAFGGHLRVPVVPWLLAAVAAWQIAYGLRRHARAGADAAAGSD